jgi:hypothetical protein
MSLSKLKFQAKYFTKKEDMLRPLRSASSSGHSTTCRQFLVMHEELYGESKPVHMFAHYFSKEQFYRILQTVHNEEQAFYEIIPQDRPCRLYVDVEWNSKSDNPAATAHPRVAGWTHCARIGHYASANIRRYW